MLWIPLWVKTPTPLDAPPVYLPGGQLLHHVQPGTGGQVLHPTLRHHAVHGAWLRWRWRCCAGRRVFLTPPDGLALQVCGAQEIKNTIEEHLNIKDGGVCCGAVDLYRLVVP